MGREITGLNLVNIMPDYTRHMEEDWEKYKTGYRAVYREDPDAP